MQGSLTGQIPFSEYRYPAHSRNTACIPQIPLQVPSGTLGSSTSLALLDTPPPWEQVHFHKYIKLKE